MTKRKQPWRCQSCDCLGKTIPRAHPRSKLCKWCAEDLAKAGKRWCSMGRHGAPADQFTPTSPYTCRACTAAANARYRAANREETLAYGRAYHAEHRDELVERNRAYYRKNREQLLEQKREYYQQHREKLKARSRAYRRRGLPEASKAKIRERFRAKRHIYKANEKISRARRLLRMLRPEPRV